MNLENTQPLISICIPTYNRSKKLAYLLEALLVVKKAQQNRVEICISNNCSTDDTANVIDEWRSLLDIKDITQDTNIGSMRNCVAVTSISSGQWVLMMGDDDSINTTNFFQLLDTLHSSNANWFFCGVGNPSGNEYLLGDLSEGSYTKKGIQKEMIRVGLYRFGFIGMHVFPGRLRSAFAELTVSQIECWPHIGLLMHQLSNKGNYVVSHSPIVIQSVRGNDLFFHVGDWVKVNVCKMKITAESFKKKKTDFIFHIRLIVREMFSYRNFVDLLMWRILEPKSFYKDSFLVYFKIYFLFKSFSILNVGHFILLSVLHLVPNTILKFILFLFNKHSILNIYAENKNCSKSINAIGRGL
ncbi:glycosyltransferase [Amylibacter sp.]|nr:glycosyltransferase [Amylibacter sp.]